MVKITNGGAFEPVSYIPSEPEPEPEPTITKTSIIVDGIEYDTTNLTGIQKITLEALKLTYMNFSQASKDAMSFEVYVYRVAKLHIFRSLFEPNIIDETTQLWIEPVLDVDFESPSFTIKLWYSDIKQKIKTLKEVIPFLVPLVIGVGAVGASLVGYQYSKSYVSEKGKVKARS